MRALLILACSATKVAYGGPEVPAITRYDGPAWRVLRKALRERPELAEQLTAAALSARYGLVRADHPIAYYDQRMTPARAAELGRDMRDQLALPAWRGPWDAVLVNVGADYRPALPELPWPATWAQGTIGERLAQLKAWLSALQETTRDQP